MQLRELHSFLHCLNQNQDCTTTGSHQPCPRTGPPRRRGTATAEPPQFSAPFPKHPSAATAATTPPPPPPHCTHLVPTPTRSSRPKPHACCHVRPPRTAPWPHGTARTMGRDNVGELGDTATVVWDPRHRNVIILTSIVCTGGPPATVTLGRLLASPSGANRTGTKPLHHDTVAGPRRSVVLVVVVVVDSKRIIIVRGTDLNKKNRLFSSVQCVFCFTSNENCHFSSEKTVTFQNGLLIFFGKTHITKKHGNRRGFRRTFFKQQRQPLEIFDGFPFFILFSFSIFSHFYFFYIHTRTILKAGQNWPLIIAQPEA